MDGGTGTIAADMHVHVYPCHNARLVVDSLRSNMARIAPGAAQAAFLAERHDCSFFDGLQHGKVPDGYRVLQTAERNALVLQSEDGQAITLFAGRQIISEERIEVLSLTADVRELDGQPASTVVKKVLEVGGLPVVSWAPGKWLGRRGAVVLELLNEFSGMGLFAGDSTLRPRFFPEPGLMKFARYRGIEVVAGSDPLPFAGEETVAGSYVSLWDGRIIADCPVKSVRDLIRAGAPRTAGSRTALPGVLRRLVLNARVRGKRHG